MSSPKGGRIALRVWMRPARFRQPTRFGCPGSIMTSSAAGRVGHRWWWRPCSTPWWRAGSKSGPLRSISRPLAVGCRIFDRPCWSGFEVGRASDALSSEKEVSAARPRPGWNPRICQLGSEPVGQVLHTNAGGGFEPSLCFQKRKLNRSKRSSWPNEAQSGSGLHAVGSLTAACSDRPMGMGED